MAAKFSGCIFSNQHEDELQTGNVPAVYIPIYCLLDETLTEAEEYVADSEVNTHESRTTGLLVVITLVTAGGVLWLYLVLTRTSH